MSEEEIEWLRMRNWLDVALYSKAQIMFTLDSTLFGTGLRYCEGFLHVGSVSVPEACKPFLLPATIIEGDLKSILARRRTNQTPFSCGCGWVGSKSTEVKISSAAALMNVLPQRQNCPNLHMYAYSSVDT